MTGMGKSTDEELELLSEGRSGSVTPAHGERLRYWLSVSM
jgi:hypothetical protein